ncbi:hypothetical protein Trydic_g19958 [Trypoxylus dichotomus]
MLWSCMSTAGVGKMQTPEAADEFRWKVRTAIEKAKPKQIRQNISKVEQRSLKERQEYQDLAGGQRKRYGNNGCWKL